jgi:hypothetical protein
MRGLVKALLKWLFKKPDAAPPRAPPPAPRPTTKPGCTTNCDKPNPYRSLTREQQERAKRTLEKRIAEHEQKLADYRRNPAAHDNDGRYANAPTDAIRQQVYEGRIAVLVRDIAKQRGELAKVIDALGG